MCGVMNHTYTAHITKTLAGLLAAAVLLATLSSVSVRASQAPAATPAPSFSAKTATEAVLYRAGFADATSEVFTPTADTATATPPILLRILAGYNRMHGNMFVLDNPVFAAYLYGRADAFEAAADLVGEPPL